MRHVSTLFVVLFVGVLVVGITASTAQAQLIDPNIGFCTPPPSATACSGQPETNGIASGGTIGMWSFGGDNTNSPWFLILAVPNGTYSLANAPKLSSTSFNSGNLTSPFFVTGASTTPPNFTSSSSPNDIYAYLGSVIGNLPGNNSMNTTNLFGSLEVAAFGSTPSYFQLLVYSFAPGLTANTGYTFTSNKALPAGTFIAAIAPCSNSDNSTCSTPFTTAGLVGGPVPEPASLTLMGSGLMLLAGALRRRFLA